MDLLAVVAGSTYVWT